MKQYMLGARRPAAAPLHLLPPRARPGRAGGAHPPAARWPRNPGDRPRLPGARADHGPADRPRQAEDQGRGCPVPDPDRSGASEPPAARARGALPDLQRGVRGQRRNRSRPRRPPRRGDPAGPGAGCSDAGRGRGRRPAGTAAARRVAAAGPDRAGRRARRRRRAARPGGGPGRGGPARPARLPPVPRHPGGPAGTVGPHGRRPRGVRHGRGAGHERDGAHLPGRPAGKLR